MFAVPVCCLVFASKPQAKTVTHTPTTVTRLSLALGPWLQATPREEPEPGEEVTAFKETFGPHRGMAVTHCSSSVQLFLLCLHVQYQLQEPLEPGSGRPNDRTRASFPRCSGAGSWRGLFWV